MAALMLPVYLASVRWHPINVWGDANCLLTVGRVMKRGENLSIRIYEQKECTAVL